jgi:hypothetical protein
MAIMTRRFVSLAQAVLDHQPYFTASGAIPEILDAHQKLRMFIPKRLLLHRTIRRLLDA